MTTQTDLAEMLLPFAEAPCPGQVWLPNRVDPHGEHCEGGCAGTGLDPRFAALRHYEHEMVGPGVGSDYCALCDYTDLNEDMGLPRWGLRTDLGSIYDVAKACGFHFLNMTARADGKWLCEFFGPGDGSDGYPPSGEGDTKEDAAAWALVAAVGELK